VRSDFDLVEVCGTVLAAWCVAHPETSGTIRRNAAAAATDAFRTWLCTRITTLSDAKERRCKSKTATISPF